MTEGAQSKKHVRPFLLSKEDKTVSSCAINMQNINPICKIYINISNIYMVGRGKTQYNHNQRFPMSRQEDKRKTV